MEPKDLKTIRKLVWNFVAIHIDIRIERRKIEWVVNDWHFRALAAKQRTPKDFRALPFNDLVSLEQDLARGDVAGFVVEPIQGKGANVHYTGYLVDGTKVDSSERCLLAVHNRAIVPSCFFLV